MLVVGQTTNVQNQDNIISQQISPKGLATNATGAATAFDACARGAAGKYVAVGYAAASPYITAKLYDDTTDTWTALTISGALAEATVSSNHQMILVYSDSQGKYYLKSNNTSVKKIYPLTLSGTTLTVGTAIDFSAQFAGTSATVTMTSDRSDLYLMDTAGVLKKYTIGGSSWSAALSAPSVTGIYTTSMEGWKFHCTNGYLIFAACASGGLTTALTKFQTYNIAGNTWTTQTVLFGTQAGQTSVANDSNWAYLNIFADTSTTDFYYTTYSAIYKFNWSTLLGELIVRWGKLTTGGIPNEELGWWSNSGNYARFEGATDISRGFGMKVNQGGSPMNALGYLLPDAFPATYYWKYTGAGYLYGFNCPSTIGIAGNYLFENLYLKFRIDGTTTYIMTPGGVNSMLYQGRRIAFTTSLEIFAVHAGYQVDSLLSVQYKK